MSTITPSIPSFHGPRIPSVRMRSRRTDKMRGMVDDLSKENDDYYSSMRLLMKTTDDVTEANEALKEAIAERKNSMMGIINEISESSRQLERAISERNKANQRLKKYEKRINIQEKRTPEEIQAEIKNIQEKLDRVPQKRLDLGQKAEKTDFILEKNKIYQEILEDMIEINDNFQNRAQEILDQISQNNKAENMTHQQRMQLELLKKEVQRNEDMRGDLIGKDINASNLQDHEENKKTNEAISVVQSNVKLSTSIFTQLDKSLEKNPSFDETTTEAESEIPLSDFASKPISLIPINLIDMDSGDAHQQTVTKIEPGFDIDEKRTALEKIIHPRTGQSYLDKHPEINPKDVKIRKHRPPKAVSRRKRFNELDEVVNPENNYVDFMKKPTEYDKSEQQSEIDGEIKIKKIKTPKEYEHFTVDMPSDTPVQPETNENDDEALGTLVIDLVDKLNPSKGPKNPKRIRRIKEFEYVEDEGEDGSPIIVKKKVNYEYNQVIDSENKKKFVRQEIPYQPIRYILNEDNKVVPITLETKEQDYTFEDGTVRKVKVIVDPPQYEYYQVENEYGTLDILKRPKQFHYVELEDDKLNKRKVKVEVPKPEEFEYIEVQTEDPENLGTFTKSIIKRPIQFENVEHITEDGKTFFARQPIEVIEYDYEEIDDNGKKKICKKPKEYEFFDYEDENGEKHRAKREIRDPKDDIYEYDEVNDEGEIKYIKHQKYPQFEMTLEDGTVQKVRKERPVEFEYEEIFDENMNKQIIKKPKLFLFKEMEADDGHKRLVRYEKPHEIEYEYDEVSDDEHQKKVVKREIEYETVTREIDGQVQQIRIQNPNIEYDYKEIVEPNGTTTYIKIPHQYEFYEQEVDNDDGSKRTRKVRREIPKENEYEYKEVDNKIVSEVKVYEDVVMESENGEKHIVKHQISPQPVEFDYSETEDETTKEKVIKKHPRNYEYVEVTSEEGKQIKVKRLIPLEKEFEFVKTENGVEKVEKQFEHIDIESEGGTIHKNVKVESIPKSYLLTEQENGEKVLVGKENLVKYEDIDDMKVKTFQVDDSDFNSYEYDEDEDGTIVKKHLEYVKDKYEDIEYSKPLRNDDTEYEYDEIENDNGVPVVEKYHKKVEFVNYKDTKARRTVPLFDNYETVEMNNDDGHRLIVHRKITDNDQFKVIMNGHKPSEKISPKQANVFLSKDQENDLMCIQSNSDASDEDLSDPIPSLDLSSSAQHSDLEYDEEPLQSNKQSQSEAEEEMNDDIMNAYLTETIKPIFDASTDDEDDKLQSDSQMIEESTIDRKLAHSQLSVKSEGTPQYENGKLLSETDALMSESQLSNGNIDKQQLSEDATLLGVSGQKEGIETNIDATEISSNDPLSPRSNKLDSSTRDNPSESFINGKKGGIQNGINAYSENELLTENDQRNKIQDHLMDGNPSSTFLGPTISNQNPAGIDQTEEMELSDDDKRKNLVQQSTSEGPSSTYLGPTLKQHTPGIDPSEENEISDDYKQKEMATPSASDSPSSKYLGPTMNKPHTPGIDQNEETELSDEDKHKSINQQSGSESPSSKFLTPSFDKQHSSEIDQNEETELIDDDKHKKMVQPSSSDNPHQEFLQGILNNEMSETKLSSENQLLDGDSLQEMKNMSASDNSDNSLITSHILISMPTQTPSSFTSMNPLKIITEYQASHPTTNEQSQTETSITQKPNKKLDMNIIVQQSFDMESEISNLEISVNNNEIDFVSNNMKKMDISQLDDENSQNSFMDIAEPYQTIKQKPTHKAVYKTAETQTGLPFISHYLSTQITFEEHQSISSTEILDGSSGADEMELHTDLSSQTAGEIDDREKVQFMNNIEVQTNESHLSGLININKTMDFEVGQQEEVKKTYLTNCYISNNSLSFESYEPESRNTIDVSFEIEKAFSEHFSESEEIPEVDTYAEKESISIQTTNSYTARQKKVGITMVPVPEDPKLVTNGKYHDMGGQTDLGAIEYICATDFEEEEEEHQQEENPITNLTEEQLSSSNVISFDQYYHDLQEQKDEDTIEDLLKQEEMSKKRDILWAFEEEEEVIERRLLQEEIIKLAHKDVKEVNDEEIFNSLLNEENEKLIYEEDERARKLQQEEIDKLAETDTEEEISKERLTYEEKDTFTIMESSGDITYSEEDKHESSLPEEDDEENAMNRLDEENNKLESEARAEDDEVNEKDAKLLRIEEELKLNSIANIISDEEELDKPEDISKSDDEQDEDAINSLLDEEEQKINDEQEVYARQLNLLETDQIERFENYLADKIFQREQDNEDFLVNENDLFDEENDKLMSESRVRCEEEEDNLESRLVDEENLKLNENVNEEEEIPEIPTGPAIQPPETIDSTEKVEPIEEEDIPEIPTVPVMKKPEDDEPITQQQEEVVTPKKDETTDIVIQQEYEYYDEEYEDSVTYFQAVEEEVPSTIATTSTEKGKLPNSKIDDYANTIVDQLLISIGETPKRKPQLQEITTQTATKLIHSKVKKTRRVKRPKTTPAEEDENEIPEIQTLPAITDETIKKLVDDQKNNGEEEEINENIPTIPVKKPGDDDNEDQLNGDEDDKNKLNPNEDDQKKLNPEEDDQNKLNPEEDDQKKVNLEEDDQNKLNPNEDDQNILNPEDKKKLPSSKDDEKSLDHSDSEADDNEAIADEDDVLGKSSEELINLIDSEEQIKDREIEEHRDDIDADPIMEIKDQEEQQTYNDQEYERIRELEELKNKELKEQDFQENEENKFSPKPKRHRIPPEFEYDEVSDVDGTEIIKKNLVIFDEIVDEQTGQIKRVPRPNKADFIYYEDPYDKSKPLTKHEMQYEIHDVESIGGTIVKNVRKPKEDPEYEWNLIEDQKNFEEDENGITIQVPNQIMKIKKSFVKKWIEDPNEEPESRNKRVRHDVTHPDEEFEYEEVTDEETNEHKIVKKLKNYHFVDMESENGTTRKVRCRVLNEDGMYELIEITEFDEEKGCNVSKIIKRLKAFDYFDFESENGTIHQHVKRTINQPINNINCDENGQLFEYVEVEDENGHKQIIKRPVLFELADVESEGGTVRKVQREKPNHEDYEYVEVEDENGMKKIVKKPIKYQFVDQEVEEIDSNGNTITSTRKVKKPVQSDDFEYIETEIEETDETGDKVTKKVIVKRPKQYELVEMESEGGTGHTVKRVIDNSDDFEYELDDDYVVKKKKEFEFREDKDEEGNRIVVKCPKNEQEFEYIESIDENGNKVLTPEEVEFETVTALCEDGETRQIKRRKPKDDDDLYEFEDIVDENGNKKRIKRLKSAQSGDDKLESKTPGEDNKSDEVNAKSKTDEISKIESTEDNQSKTDEDVTDKIEGEEDSKVNPNEEEDKLNQTEQDKLKPSNEDDKLNENEQDKLQQNEKDKLNGNDDEDNKLNGNEEDKVNGNEEDKLQQNEQDKLQQNEQDKLNGNENEEGEGNENKEKIHIDGEDDKSNQKKRVKKRVKRLVKGTTLTTNENGDIVRKDELDNKRNELNQTIQKSKLSKFNRSHSISNFPIRNAIPKIKPQPSCASLDDNVLSQLRKKQAQQNKHKQHHHHKKHSTDDQTKDHTTETEEGHNIHIDAEIEYSYYSDDDGNNMKDDEMDSLAEFLNDEYINTKRTGNRDFARKIWNNAFQQRLDRAQLEVAVSDARYELSNARAASKDIADEIELTEFEIRQRQPNLEFMRMMSTNYSPISNQDKVIGCQTTLTSSDLRSIDTRIKDCLETNKSYQYQKENVETLQKYIDKLSKKKDNISNAFTTVDDEIEVLEKEIKVYKPHKNDEPMPPERRNRINLQKKLDDRKKMNETMSKTLKTDQIEARKLRGRIDDMKNIHDMLKKKLAEERTNERPDVTQMVRRLNILKKNEKTAKEKAKMLTIEEEDADRQLQKLELLTSQSNVTRIEMNIQQLETKIGALKEQFTMKKKIAPRKNKRYGLTIKGDLEELEMKRKDIAMQMTLLSRKEEELRDNITAISKAMQTKKLRIPIPPQNQ